MNKLGSYITKLMTTIIEEEDFVKNLALDELKKLNNDIEGFIRKHSQEDKDLEKKEKQLLQEDKENVKNK
tara:strand:- start:26 stop:235 length:210 start_codon:yes stop_codon:yes gene_type:complete